MMAPSAPPSSAPVSDLSPNDYEHPLDTSAYWVGLIPACPNGYVPIGGISFPKSNDRVFEPKQGGGLTSRSPQMGAKAHLTAEQVAHIRDEAALYVFRISGPRGKRRMALKDSRPLWVAHPMDPWPADPGEYDRMHNPESPQYPPRNVGRHRPQRGDHPAGCYAYMVPWADRHRYGDSPPTMCEMPADALALLSGQPETQPLELPVPA